MACNNSELVRLDFEVFGTVQGVCFRMYAQQQGNLLGIRGKQCFKIRKKNPIWGCGF